MSLGVSTLMIGSYFIPEDRRLQAIVERDIAAARGGEVKLSPDYQGGDT